MALTPESSRNSGHTVDVQEERGTPSYVYILMHHCGRRFKIGKAVDIDARAHQLGKRRFNEVGSFGLQFATETRSLEAEGALHRLFAGWRCDSQEVAAEDGTVSGATEFFQIECYDHVVDFVERNLAILQAEPVYDLTQVFDTAEDSEKLRRRQVAAARAAAREARQHARQQRKDEIYQRGMRGIEDQIVGPITSAINVLVNACTVSVRGREYLFVASSCDSDAVEESVRTLFDAKFSVDGLGCFALCGEHVYSPDEDSDRVRHLLTFNSDEDCSSFGHDCLRRVVAILRSCPRRSLSRDDVGYHTAFWDSHVDHEVMKIDEFIPRLERTGDADYAQVWRGHRHWYINLKPDFLQDEVHP